MKMIYNWLPFEKGYRRIDQCAVIEALITALNAMIILVIDSILPLISRLKSAPISVSCLSPRHSSASRWSLNFFLYLFRLCY